MKLETRRFDQIIIPYPAEDPAAWTRNSRFAVGRARRTGFVELAIGSGAVAHGRRIGKHVSLALLDMTDEEMRRLAAAEEQGAPLPFVAAAMGFLVDKKLGIGHAGEVFGLKDKGEASRLNQVRKLDREILGVIEAKRMTRNHVRWILGLPTAVALEGVSKHSTVKALRNWRKDLEGQHADSSGVSPGTEAALVSESRRISEVLGSEARVETSENGGWRLVVGYSSVETLAGVLERMGAGYGEAPGAPEGAKDRTIVLDGLSPEDLEYLTGREE